MAYEELKDLKFQNYENSTEVINIGGASLTLEDVLKAAIISKQNIYLIGETGEGKTQIENDILGIFGNRGFFEQGRNDLEVREMFTRLNLDKIYSREARTTEEVKELTDKVNNPVFVVDELTRCIPAVQNQFFNFFDGFITVDGRKYTLGNQGYSIGIASGNIGNGRYVGASETDRALLDRMHLLIDVDNFTTQPDDDLDVFTTRIDPRVRDASSNDQFEKILRLREEVSGRQIPLINYVAAIYLRKGLNYLDGVPGNSKRKVKNAWPQVVQGHAKGDDSALVFPISMRAGISYLNLSKALEAVAESKGAKIEDHLQAFFETFRLAGAYSGILNPMEVQQNYYGNPYLAMDAVVDGVRKEFESKYDAIATAIGTAKKGKIDGKLMNEFKGRWSFMQPSINKAAMEAKQRQGAGKNLGQDKREK